MACNCNDPFIFLPGYWLWKLINIFYYCKKNKVWDLMVFSRVAKKNLPAMQIRHNWTRFDSWVEKIRWRRDRLPTPLFLGFPCGSAGKESTCSVGDLSLFPGLGTSPGEGKGYPLQYSGLENSMNSIFHGFSKSQTLLSDFHFHFLFRWLINHKNLSLTCLWAQDQCMVQACFLVHS